MPDICVVCEAAFEGSQCPVCGTPRRPVPRLAARALPPGTRLQGGQYALGTVRGAGGFGITYAGFDRTLHRRVAVKEFFPSDCIRAGRTVRPAGSAAAPLFARLRSRFLDEARALARCVHPGVVPVYAFFEENQTAYIVMEWVEGRTLQEMLDRNGPLAPAAALEIARQVGAALEATHAAGLAHRDVKPDNVLVTAQGRALLLDFGTARAFASVPGARSTVMVTPGYAPPEQYDEAAPRGPAMDVYALAATLYHAMSGRVPEPADQRRAGAAQDPPPGVPPAVAAVIMHGLVLDEGARPATPGAFVHALEAAVTAAAPAPNGTPAGRSVAVARRAVLTGHRGWVRGLAFSPDGAVLASGSEDRTVRLWDVATGLERVRFATAGWIDDVVFAEGGRVVAAVSHDGSVRVWSVESGEPAWYAQERSPGTGLAVSWDGRRLAAGFQSGGVVVWQAADGAELERMTSAGSGIADLAFRADGSHLVAAWKGKPAPALWPLGGASRPLPAAGAPLRCVAVRGRRLAAGASNGAIESWDLDSGRLLPPLRGHRGAVLSVAFAGDGRLVSGAQDGTIRVWDLATARELANLPDHAGAVAAVGCAPAGDALASGGQDGKVMLWSLAP